MNIRILIADDHQLVIDGILLMLKEAPGISCVATAGNGQEALEQLSKYEVDVLLLDINMPVMDGIECCRLATRQHPSLKILVLSMMNDASLVKQMLKEGAAGFLLKNAGQDEVITAIKKVHQGDKAFSQEVLSIIMDSLSGVPANKNNPSIPRISPREKQILSMIVWEKTTQEIAEELFISFGTVETHRRNLLHKLDVRNTAGLVRVALEHGLLE